MGTPDKNQTYVQDTVTGPRPPNMWETQITALVEQYAHTRNPATLKRVARKAVAYALSLQGKDYHCKGPAFCLEELQRHVLNTFADDGLFSKAFMEALEEAEKDQKAREAQGTQAEVIEIKDISGQTATAVTETTETLREAA